MTQEREIELLKEGLRTVFVALNNDLAWGKGSAWKDALYRIVAELDDRKSSPTSTESAASPRPAAPAIPTREEMEEAWMKAVGYVVYPRIGFAAVHALVVSRAAKVSQTDIELDETELAKIIGVHLDESGEKWRALLPHARAAIAWFRGKMKA